MKIEEFEQYLTKEKRYNLFIKDNENLNAWEIALCFQNQFPDLMAVISFSKSSYKKDLLEMGFIILGLNIK